MALLCGECLLPFTGSCGRYVIVDESCHIHESCHTSYGSIMHRMPSRIDCLAWQV